MFDPVLEPYLATPKIFLFAPPKMVFSRFFYAY